jgi:1-acyl-sn-glycerol-3-phosphate acyltransferase
MPQRKAAPDRKTAPDEFGMDPDLVWYLMPFFQFLYHHYFRVDAEGVENIPEKEPAIIVANHAGGIPYDGVMVNLAVYNEHPKKRSVRFLVHDFAVDMPLLGQFIQKAGGVRASPKNAQLLLKKSQLILVFPEGIKGVGKPYDKKYKLQKFGRGGFIRIAIRSRAPIIPTAIIGSEEIHPIVYSSQILGKSLGVPFIPLTPTFPWLGPLGLIPLPTKWKIIFGKPIILDHLKPIEAENDLLVEKLAEDVRKKIQKTIDAALAKRKSIWF